LFAPTPSIFFLSYISFLSTRTVTFSINIFSRCAFRLETSLRRSATFHSNTMAANGSAMPDQASEILDKGKGKSVEEPTPDMTMEDDDDDEEESGVDEVRPTAHPPH
jgi:hypothetical protein